ncbi:hypothetical protein BDZ45DRAFT_661169 [Acephala macrosclerotiorum]|nr:hypothetical protein BDZ45DRAFT_661169 [Acephala macrosclerotiorum]
MAGDEAWYGKWTATALVVVPCTRISISNALELLLLVLVTFEKWKGLYFWSLLVTSFSVLPYSVGFLVEYLELHHLLRDIMNNIGWAVMASGQSVVLYSRLGIILHNQNTLKAVLWMIVVNGVVFYTITTVIHYGTYTDIATFDKGSFVIEKIQMTVYCVQESIISGLYVREVWRMSRIVILAGRKKRIMWELLAINLVIIGLDIALLCLEYLNLSVIEQTFKGLAYSFKLKMELAILGKLVEVAHANSGGQADFRGNGLVDSDEHSHVHSKPDATHAMAG